MIRCKICAQPLQVNTETEWKTDEDTRPKYSAYCPNCLRWGVVLVEDYKLELIIEQITKDNRKEEEE